MKWVGVGPGRCGTQSLARIFRARHEEHDLPFIPTDESLVIARRLADIEEPPCVGFQYLNHIQALRSSDPKLPVVCLRRDFDAVVASHKRISKGWQGRARYPNWQGVPEEAQWGVWWWYCETQMNLIVQPRYDFHMSWLNDDAELEKLGSWLGRAPNLAGPRNVDVNRLGGAGVDQ